MKTISRKSTPAVKTFSFKSALARFFQWIGAFVAFIVSMGAANIIPLPGFESTGSFLSRQLQQSSGKKVDIPQ
jgi:hypothetical protein